MSDDQTETNIIKLNTSPRKSKSKNSNSKMSKYFHDDKYNIYIIKSIISKII